MVSSLTLDDAAGGAVTLHSTSKRKVSRITGLPGVAGVRQQVRARPTAHGVIDDTRYLGPAPVTIDGQIERVASEAEAFTELRAITKPMVETLKAAALLKWVEGAGTVTNHVPNPSLELDAAGYSDSGNTQTTPSRTTAQFKVGSAALKVAKATGPYTDPYSKVVLTGAALDPLKGKTVTFATYARPDSATKHSDSPNRIILIFDGIAPAEAQLTTLTPGVWQRVSVSLAVAAAATVLELRFYNAQASGDGYFDATTLTEGTTLPEYFDGDSPNSIWTGARHNSTSIFNPPKQQAVKLASDVATVLQPGPALLRYHVALLAEDPRAYTQTQVTATSTALSVSAGGLIFPEPFPWKFNASTGGEATVINNGNADSPPVLRIYGYCTNPRVQLETTGEVIALTGQIDSGSYMEVDVQKRTVKLNGAVSRLNQLDFAATTFWELPSGTHTIQLLASSFDSGAKVDVLYRSAYL